MKCSICGAEFEGNFCPECGNAAIVSASDVNNTTTIQSQPDQNSFQPTQQNKKDNKKKKPFYKRWWFIVICIVMAFLLFGNTGNDNSKAKKEYDTLTWSSFTLHDKLPEPGSNVGKIISDGSNSLSLTIGETDKSSYNEYVEKCMSEFGYTIDKSRSDSSFSATSEDDYEVTIYFNDSNEEMEICLGPKAEDDEDKTTGAEVTTETKTEPAETESEKPNKDDSEMINGMRKEFKEAMDSYEEFYDSYIDFMKSYDANNFTMLSKYAELVSKVAEVDEKFNKWKDDDLNKAETAYYIEVQARVSKKLLDI